MSDFSTIPEPGWYYADGDPVGTHRYWDGAQWVGGPQPVAGGFVIAAASGPFAGREAGWGERLGAWVIDQIVMWFFYVVGLVVAGQQASDDDAAVLTLVFFGLVVLLAIGNSWIYQGLTGFTIGKKMLGIQLLRDESGAPPGVLFAFLRGFVSGLFTTFTCYIYFLLDHLWPLWDDQSKRITDRIVSTTVVKSRT